MRIKVMKIVIGFLFLVTSATGFSQFAPDTIKVNFLEIKSIPKYDKVHYGHKYVMRIENINQSLYKIESTVSQQSFNTDIPDVFKDINLPAFLNYMLPDIHQNEFTKGIPVPGAKPVDYKNLIIYNLIIINNSIKKIESTVELNNSIRNLFNSCDKPYEEIQTRLISVVNDFLGKNISDRKIQAQKLENYLKRIIQSAENAGEALDTLFLLYLDSPRKDSLKTIVTKAKESVAEMKKFKDENKIQELISNYNMINYSNFTFTAEPVQIKADEVKFDIKITANKQLPCNIPAKTNISETYKTIGGWKLDFSTGIFFNVGNEDFLGRELQYIPFDNSTVTIQTKNGGRRSLLSLGGLMHIYYRREGSVNWAVSPGLSTTSAFDGIIFHLGGSAIFGWQNRIVLSAGISLREAQVLDRNYHFEQHYATTDLPETPPIIKVFPKSGYFVSLTYNWSKSTKQ